MGGGLMQLVAYGAQDIYLSGNPQITFFKVVYRRHTNFSMESIEQTFNGSANFNSNVTCPISRNGDLIHKIYLQATLTASTSDAAVTEINFAGHTLLKSVEVEIGGQRIDKHYSEWLSVWNELTQTVGHWEGYKTMTSVPLEADDTTTTIYVPLQFWFCRNPGLALPLIALQYHEVKINVEFGNLNGDVSIPNPDLAAATTNPFIDVTNTVSLDSASLWVDYIYLDTDERRRFAQVSHEYLIEQLQFTGDEQPDSKIKLNFNHPVKELVWVEYNGGVPQSTYSTAKLQLNGHERFAERPASYFQLVQPYQHHERVPTNDPDDTTNSVRKMGNVNVYSFALKPEEHQPSGTCNMSRIDNATLNLSGLNNGITVDDNKTDAIKVFAVNYNVLRVMSGMGGLAYSN
jgi:hypothetical protein